jgi:hypothetical protein
VGRRAAAGQDRPLVALGVKGSWVRIPPSRLCERPAQLAFCVDGDEFAERIVTLDFARTGVRFACCRWSGQLLIYRVIDPKKIIDYAMNPDHPVGGNKYKVIKSATGLDTGDAATIEQQIRDGVRDAAPILGKADQYGQRWAVDVSLTGPTGSIVVRTAWILDTGSSTPRLITISFP